MRTPTEYELDRLLHYAPGYDPVAAKKYYEEHKHLKGRRKGQAPKIYEDDPRWNPKTMGNHRGFTREQMALQAKARKRGAIMQAIDRMEKKLKELEALIRKKEHEAASEDRKGKAKKERAAKERDKPDSAADKAEKARENKKYREKHEQELKSKEKSRDKKSGGGSSKKSGTGKKEIHELKALVTKYKGRIAVAKQKLAAL